MAERDIAAEVLQGLREVKEYRAGKRTLRTTRVEANPAGTYVHLSPTGNPLYLSIVEADSAHGAASRAMAIHSSYAR